MRSLFHGFFAGLLITALGSLAASAQTIPFTLLAASNGSSVTVLNDGSIGITAQVGTQAQVVVTATYTGTSQATFATKPQSVGSTQFSVALTGTLPIVLSPGQALTFTVTYAPTNANGATTQVTLPFTEPGSTGTPVSNAIVLVFQGNSPSFVLSYILQANNNTVVIPPGGTIPFLPTQINTTANANLDITNQGSGPGTITAITPPAAGSPFKLSGTPLLPATLTTGQTLQLTVSYSPTSVQSTPDMGQVTITFENGITATVLLSGTGSTSSLTYNVISGGTTTPVKPPGPIVLPPVNVTTSGSTAPSSSVIVQVVNSGNATGTINSISVSSGQGFQLVNPPTTAPVLAPGGTFSFTISYTPTQVGPQTGTLEIGNDIFTLSGTGLGPQLTFSYVSNGATIPASGNTGVVFPSIAISKSENVMFTVTNSGTLPATITLITASPTPPFSVPTLPPATLAPGQMTSFPITFAPTTVGPVTGSLSVNGAIVPLFGAGSAPPTLSSYTLAGPSGNVAPLSQAGVTLTLANSYPVDLQGVLTLTTSGNYGTDPAVQFSTGSSAGNRTVDFVIPAGSTSADFAGQGSQILLQTGTVAETVTLTPAFTTSGGVDITPSPAPTLQFTVASSAPVLLSSQISNETASSFTLLLIGYSTTRSLSSLNVTFNPAAGFNLGATQFMIDLSAVSTLWFASTASQSLGGQFEISVPFQLTGTVRAGSSLIQTIASLSATVGNALGVSNLLETNVQ